MGYLILCDAAVGIYTGLYAWHCFRKKHWMAAIAVSVFTGLVLACIAALLYLGR